MALTNQAIHMVYSICFPMRSHSCQGTPLYSSIDTKRQPHHSQYSSQPSLPSMSMTQATVSFRGRHFRDGKGTKICQHRDQDPQYYWINFQMDDTGIRFAV